MKARLLNISAILLSIVVLKAHAQCVRGISTNPQNPINPEMEMLYPGKTNVFLNSFEWAELGVSGFGTIMLNHNAQWNIPNWTPHGQDFIMVNPYSSAMPSEYGYLQRPHSYMDRDFHWEDGWELLWLNVGYYPDGQEINIASNNNIVSNAYTATNSSVPHMIIYNRYKGIVRVFFNVFSELGALDDVVTYFKFDQGEHGELPVSGLLRHLNPYDRPLSMPTDITEIESYNRQLNNNKIWYSVDFQIGYDPCTCNNASRLEFAMRGIKTSSISLQGRAISIEDSLADKYGNPKYDNKFLSNSNIRQNRDEGSVIYKKMDGLVENYKNRLEDYNTKLNDYNTYNNNLGIQAMGAVKDLVVDGSSSIVPGSAVAGWLVDKGLSLGADSSAIEEQILKGAKGALGEGYDFLTASIYGKKPTKPVRPSMPTVGYSEMNFQGTIADSMHIQIPSMFTPGTFPTAYSGNLPDLNPWNYPAYNEVLGMFATLNVPKLQFYIDHDEDFWFEHEESYEAYSHQNISFKLSEPIKYALNPALDFDMDKTKIRASLQITLKSREGLTDPNDKISRSWLEGGAVDMAHWFRPCDPPTQNCVHEIILQTDFVEPGLLYNQRFYGTMMSSVFDENAYEYKVLLPPDLLRLEVDKIELKILADMYFEQLGWQGDPVNTTQVFTYLLHSAEGNCNLPIFRTACKYTFPYLGLMCSS